MRPGSPIKLVFSLLIISVCLQSFSQTNTSNVAHNNFPFNHFEYINSAQGLNGVETWWGLQDRRGFLWFVTDNALNRYDGYTFRTYAYKSDDPNSMTPDWNCQLAEDKNGLIWIATRFQGVFSFDPEHEKFTSYHNEPGNANSLLYGIENSIAIQNDSTVWMSNSGGLSKFNPDTKSFTYFLHDDNDSSTISKGHVMGLFFESGNSMPNRQNNLWIVNQTAGIELLNTQTGKVFQRFKYHLPECDFELSERWRLRTNRINNETIWIGSNDRALYGFNILTRKYFRIPIRHGCNNSVHAFHGVFEDHAGNLWATNDNNEIIYYDRSNKKFYFHAVEKNSFLDLPPVIEEDNSHKIWLATVNGIITVDNEFKKFTLLQHDDNHPNSLSGSFVYAIKRSKSGNFYVGSNTLDIFDRSTNIFSHVKFIENGRTLNTIGVWSIYEEGNNRIWFSGDAGVIRYDVSKKICHAMRFSNDSSDLSSYPCIGVLVDKSGRYWTVNYDYGLYLFDPVTGKSKVFSIHKISDNSSEGMATLFLDTKGFIYTNGWNAGFIRFDPDHKTFEIYHHDPKDPLSVGHETAHAFLEANNGLIWFGTFGGGINVFNPATKKFKSFTTNDGLAHNVVTSLVEDKKGNYWAGTSGGISCFKPPADPFAANCKIHFRNYDMNDGLPSNDLNYISSFCDTDGTLFFGTRNAGMFYFHPDSLKDNEFTPPVYITEFRLRNKLVSVKDSNSILKSSIEYAKEIQLNYRQNDISFSFAALNYIHPEKNQYAYKLENYDKDWIYTDASKRFANYTNLDPGEYTFKVKASNNDGVWNETPTELKIIITPPFWQTWWFKLLVVLAVAAIVYGVYRYRLQQVLHLQKIRNRIAADLHDDIGSTLNSISVFSEVAKSDPAKRDESLDMIGDSSRKVTEAMSDIVWTINPDNDSFEKVILRMRSLSYNLLRAKNIEFTFRADDALNNLKLPMEKRKNFYLIFKEILNNLIKYSQASHASFSLTNHENKNITLTIMDNGIGFDTTKPYSGNGLNNMRNRAKEMGAKLIIDSRISIGTTIQLIVKP